MSNKPRREMKEREGDVSYYGIPDFPVELRKRIAAHAKLENTTIGEVVSVGMEFYLAEFDKGLV